MVVLGKPIPRWFGSSSPSGGVRASPEGRPGLQFCTSLPMKVYVPHMRLFLATALALLALPGCGGGGAAERAPASAASAEVEPWTVAELEPSVRESVEEWLTTNSPAGTKATLTGVSCEEITETTFKCGVHGSLDENGGGSQLGHMTVVATTTGDEFEWTMTQGWTPGIG